MSFWCLIGNVEHTGEVYYYEVLKCILICLYQYIGPSAYCA